MKSYTSKQIEDAWPDMSDNSVLELLLFNLEAPEPEKSFVGRYAQNQSPDGVMRNRAEREAQLIEEMVDRKIDKLRKEFYTGAWR